MRCRISSEVSSMTARGTESGSWLAISTLVAWCRISRIVSTTWPISSDSVMYLWASSKTTSLLNSGPGSARGEDAHHDDEKTSASSFSIHSSRRSTISLGRSQESPRLVASLMYGPLGRSGPQRDDGQPR